VLENLPFDQLCIVPINHLLLHENFDQRRVSKLRKELKADGILKDPIMAVRHQNAFIVLDGATRTQAMVELGIEKIVVQLLDYDDNTIRLMRWNHLLRGIDSQQLLINIQEIVGSRGSPCKMDELEAALAAKQSLLGIVTDRGQVLSFKGPRNLDSLLPILNRVVDFYSNEADVRRISEHDIAAIQSRFPDQSAVILFPTFDPDEVIHCALNGRKVPTGITRHLINGRVRGLNIPLERLGGDQTVPSRPGWLSELIRSHELRKQIF
jgi:hypothetical protein